MVSDAFFGALDKRRLGDCTVVFVAVKGVQGSFVCFNEGCVRLMTLQVDKLGSGRVIGQVGALHMHGEVQGKL